MKESEGPLPQDQQLDDVTRASRIRSLIYSLSTEVTAAQKAGLSVDLNLHSLGLPGWVGFQDAAKITRKY